MQAARARIISSPSASENVSEQPRRELNAPPRGGIRQATRDRSMLDFHVRVQQTPSRLRVTYTVRNDSAHAVYIQNRFGPTKKCATGYLGGGKSPNEKGERKPGFSTGTACVWPSRDGTLLLFQGEVAPPQTPPPADWSEPGYSLVGAEDSTVEIELVLPLQQWENNVLRPAKGPLAKVRRVSVCVEVLLDPLTVVELEGAPGTFGCDYGQPGYVEATVDLERPIDVLTESALGSRAEWKLASLQSLVRLNGWQMRVAK